MSARLIDGVALGRTIRQEVAEEISRLKATGVVPGLAVVLVGEDPASKAYVGSKEKACLEAGMHSVKVKRDVTISEAELLGIVDQLNQDPAVHGILVQLPLPKHINTEKVLLRIDPLKDVDGFHPVNVGKLVIGDPTALRPCTPWGVIQMLVRNGIETRGANAVVVGRSDIVGKPVAALVEEPAGLLTLAQRHLEDFGLQPVRLRDLEEAFAEGTVHQGQDPAPAAVADRCLHEPRGR